MVNDRRAAFTSTAPMGANCSQVGLVQSPTVGSLRRWLTPAMFAAGRPTAIVEQIAKQLAELVWLGEFRTGSRLPTERVLAAQLQVSRPTLRAALRTLEAAGLLEIRPGRAGGAWVRTEAVPDHLLSDAHTLSGEEVAGLLEARRALEPRVAQLAAVHGTSADFELMRSLVQDQQAAPPDWELHRQLSVRFHVAIARSAHNSTLLLLMQGLLRMLAMAKSLHAQKPYEPGLVAEIHERTTTAIAGGDPRRIAAAIDEDLGLLEKVWERDELMRLGCSISTAL